VSLLLRDLLRLYKESHSVYATPGLHIENTKQLPMQKLMETIAAIREIHRMHGGMEEARALISALPTVITFDEILEYQREEDQKQGRASTFTLEQAIERARTVAAKLNAIEGLEAEVIAPSESGIVNEVVRKLSKMIKNGKTVMLEGPTGVGKTEMIRQACVLSGIDPKDVGYWSLPTLAPEDFAGIPHPDRENDAYFKYLVLQGLDKYAVMILDETNRAHPKILNALMQLMLERRINDMHFTKLKAIVLAINPPEDGNYIGAEDMDQAVRERVDHFITVKAQPNPMILALNLRHPDKFSIEEHANALELAELACEWWNELTKEQKDVVNPRRLQKVISAFIDGEGMETAIDRRNQKGVPPLDRLEKKFRQIEVLDLKTLLADPAAVEERMKAGGQDASDIVFRFVELVKQMRDKRMDAEFCKVAHLYNYVAKDHLPEPGREKSLWHFVQRAIDKHAGETAVQKFLEMLKERKDGRAAQADKLRETVAKLTSAPQDKSKKTL
jgi:MoxR-like ATPase